MHLALLNHTVCILNFSIYAYTEQLFLTQHERNLLVSKKRKHIYINKIIAHNLDFRGPGV